MLCSSRWSRASRRIAAGWLLLAWSLLASTVLAQTCGTPGWDGPVTASGVINSYHGGSGSPAAGSTSITVASAGGQRSNLRSLRAGDLILIMQMQDSTNGANAGVHEYAQIVAITGTTLSLNRPLTNSYAQAMTTSSVRSWQVIWVPQYAAATITGSVNADRWTINTSTGVATGGVVALDVAGSLSLSGTITAAGAGFRGAAGVQGTGNFAAGTPSTGNNNYTLTSAATVYGGLKGEGSQGTPPRVFDGSINSVDYLTLLGQGYAAGAGGQAAIGNAGGGSNDGDPAAGGNQYNGGGGGGSNAGAGGQGGNSWNAGGTTPALNQGTNTNIGNVVGGLGGNAQTNSATRLVMGGGGGAGSANNGGTSAITQWPPAASGTLANGAAGIVTSSGAPGGGVVLVRAGTISGSGVIDVSGYRAFNKSAGAGGTDTDGGGGGGAGGAAFITSGNGGAATLSINASGGAGGSTNYYNHGPGGGGGGGYIVTNLTGLTTNVTGGTNGTDACCGGTTGNGSPKAWNSTPGSAGAVLSTGGTAAGVQGGAACLPVLTVTKTALTPTLTRASTGATAQYTINVSNTGGAATNLFLMDQTLPPGWAYTAGIAPTFSYSPAPPPAANSNAAGAQTTSATAPGALPVTSVTTVNSATAVSLRAAGSAPGVTPTTGNNGFNFGSFYLPQNGSISVTFAVTIPATATAGTYHNPAGAIFLDPTRTTSAVRMVTPAANNNATRAGTAYSNTSYASGSTTAVLGANHSGLVAGPATDDVSLVPDFSITKTAPASATPGTTFTYTVMARNNGWALGSYTFAATQATDVASGSVGSTLGSNPLTITDTLPTGVTLSGVFTGTNWSCSGTQTQVCTLPEANAYPIAAATNFASVSKIVTVTAACSGGTTLTNTATVSVANGSSNTANNTATATTALTCGSANLQVSKTNGTSTVYSGSTTSYTVTISNLGPSAGGGVTVTDVPSSGLSCTTATCTAAGGAVCPAASIPFTSLTSGIAIPTLPANGTATLVVSCGVQ